MRCIRICFCEALKRVMGFASAMLYERVSGARCLEALRHNLTHFVILRVEVSDRILQSISHIMRGQPLINGVIRASPRSRSRSRLLPVFSVFSALGLGLGLGFLTLGKTEIFLHWIKLIYAGLKYLNFRFLGICSTNNLINGLKS